MLRTSCGNCVLAVAAKRKFCGHMKLNGLHQTAASWNGFQAKGLAKLASWILNLWCEVTPKNSLKVRHLFRKIENNVPTMKVK